LPAAVTGRVRLIHGSFMDGSEAHNGGFAAASLSQRRNMFSFFTAKLFTAT